MEVGRWGETETHRVVYENFYRDEQEMRARWWKRDVEEYEANPNDIFTAWGYLDKHPAFYTFWGSDVLEEGPHEKWLTDTGGARRCLEMEVVNWTFVRTPGGEPEPGPWVLIEAGKAPWPGDEEFRKVDRYHDYRLHVCERTFEEAVVRMAYNIHEAYGNDRRVCDAKFDIGTYAFLKEARDKENDEHQ